MKAVSVLCVAAALLAGCAARLPGPSLPAEVDSRNAKRAAEVGGWQQWGLTGRLGLDDGTDGGSGRLDWRVHGPDSTLDFRGAMGRGAWRLDITGQGARLQRADGSFNQAEGIADLVLTETGMQLPVDALQWWVRGLPQPQSTFSQRLDDNGLLLELEQLGWQIRYERWMDHGAWSMPRRLEATDGQQRVKLAVSRWWDGSGPADG